MKKTIKIPVEKSIKENIEVLFRFRKDMNEEEKKMGVSVQLLEFEKRKKEHQLKKEIKDLDEKIKEYQNKCEHRITRGDDCGPAYTCYCAICGKSLRIKN